MNDFLFILADMMKQRRINLNLKQHEVAVMAQVTKSTISRIENSKHKPEYPAVKAIASVLNIPYNDFVRVYINLEKKADTVIEILQESITKGEESTDLFKDIINRYIGVAEDSYDAIEEVYNIANTTQNTSVKLSIHQILIGYSRSHGVMPFLARSLFQVYLIERNDFTKLHSTYQSGRYILKYIDVLNSEDQTLLYYKLAVHAHTLSLFNDCIELCSLILDNMVKSEVDEQIIAPAYGILRDSFLGLGDYDNAEKYSEIFKGYSQGVTENDYLFAAVMNSKKEKKELAESQFQECLNNCSKEYYIHIANEYILFLLESDKLNKAMALISKTEDAVNELLFLHPHDRKELAWFYKLKGDYYTTVNDVNQAINSYSDSAFEYAKLDDINNERSCLKLMYNLYRNNKHMANMETVDLVDSYYERLEKEGIL
ncbi:helix-turn-helix domain-containing protein [Paenibacillus agilis]|uniref:Helix-turn-helix transcriptional regulator n=1 Tax=Paenibacillus agilis TaxID=3020863 RepID=A0A559IY50_9BACL|nr:helix-turn-helix domain-containing protein [Paenibacillus agilis]TVX92548.1 helix-turn-helix transcriptional regulator [Paenibacillus agilis]